jgi:Ser/Thr protein kinase RdoA (MazF antagonist)
MSQPLPPSIHNTQFTSDVVEQHLVSEYPLSGPITCTFIRRGFNDHYLVTTPTARYVFRVYFQGKYYIAGADDFRFELELLEHVHRAGVPVAAALPDRNGELLGRLVGPEGNRYCALFAYAEGREREPLDPVRGRRLGEVLAQFHAAAETYHTSYSRYHLDLAYLVERPMALIRSLFAFHDRENELEPFVTSISAWQSTIRRIPRIAPAYGIIHGDLHSGNYRVDSDGQFTLFDFDHGGYGWCAYDVAVCMGDMKDETAEAFLQGYQELRPLTTEEVEALPAFLKIRPIWDEGDVLAMIPVWGGPVPDAEACDRILGMFRKVTA